MPASALESLLKRERLIVAAAVLGLCLLAWLYLFHLAGRMQMMDGVAGRMMGMPADDGLSALLGAALSPGAAARAGAAANFALVAAMWAVMMVGMMTPGAAPTILLFAALERKRAPGGGGGRTAAFVAGYFVVWIAFAVGAAAAQTLLTRGGLLSMQMQTTSATLAGGVLAAAGLYEFTPLKTRCLILCRSPLDWIPRHMRLGRTGAFRMGIGHGVYCVGCCWALMLLLFVGGVMNLVWVAVIAAVVLIQKVVPGGPAIARLGGAALLLAGAGLMLKPLLSS